MAFTDYLMYKCLGLSDDIMCSFHLFLVKFCVCTVSNKKKEKN